MMDPVIQGHNQVVAREISVEFGPSRPASALAGPSRPVSALESLPAQQGIAPPVKELVVERPRSVNEVLNVPPVPDLSDSSEASDDGAAEPPKTTPKDVEYTRLDGSKVKRPPWSAPATRCYGFVNGVALRAEAMHTVTSLYRPAAAPPSVDTLWARGWCARETVNGEGYGQVVMQMPRKHRLGRHHPPRPASAPVPKYVARPDVKRQAGAIWNQPERMAASRSHLVTTPVRAHGVQVYERGKELARSAQRHAVEEHRQLLKEHRERQVTTLYRQKLRRAELEERAGTLYLDGDGRPLHNTALANISPAQYAELMRVPQIRPTKEMLHAQFLLERPDLTEKAMQFELTWQAYDVEREEQRLDGIKARRQHELGVMEQRRKERLCLEERAGQQRRARSVHRSIRC